MENSAISRALHHCRAVRNTASASAMQMKIAGNLPAIFDVSGGVGGYGNFSQAQDQGANKKRYALFRGWVYSAVNALATEAASRPVCVGRMRSERKPPSGTKSFVPGDDDGYLIRSHEINRMPSKMRNKAAAATLEVIPDHPLLKRLQHPNSMQHGYQFVYSFIANLCLTGWGYVVGGIGVDGEVEFYSVPTTWVIPDHTQGPYAQIRIVNPKHITGVSKIEPLDRTQFAFAYLPNPVDPMSALAPAGAQSIAINIDDNIQQSQVAFFDNALFPGAIVTIGKNPHPDVPGGVRPRLTPMQRRQVYGAVKKVMGGIANYGNPAIIDGMIESIDTLKMTQNEIGWEKSEKAVRTRILSAFSVHPFILGEEMAGSYAQAYVVGERFCKRVNVFLSLLGEVMTSFVTNLPQEKKADKLSNSEVLIWWEEAEVKDISLEKSIWEGARTRDDVSQDEFRAWMGLAPDEDKQQAVINKTSVQAVSTIAAQAMSGAITPEQAQTILEGMGLPEDMAKKIAGDGPAKPVDDGTGGGDPYDQNQQDPNQLDPSQQDPNQQGADQQGNDNSPYADEFKSLQSAVKELALDHAGLKTIEMVLADSRGYLTGAP